MFQLLIIIIIIIIIIIRNVLTRRTEYGTYLATARRHRRRLKRYGYKISECNSFHEFLVAARQVGDLPDFSLST